MRSLSKKFKLSNEDLKQKLKDFHEKGESVREILNDYYEKEEKNEPYSKFNEFLYYYANEYGRICTKEEIAKYANNDFINNVLYVSGYFIREWVGQGVDYNIVKEEI